MRYKVLLIIVMLALVGQASAGQYSVTPAWKNSTLVNITSMDIIAKIGFADDGGEDGNTNNWVSASGISVTINNTLHTQGLNSLQYTASTSLVETKLPFIQKTTNFSVFF
jgi:hypothetical protein